MALGGSPRASLALFRTAQALAAVSGDLTAVAEMRETFDRRRKVIWEMLSAIDGVYCPEPQGAFYAFPSFEGLLGKTFRGKTARTTIELADIALDEAKVAFVPGEAFGAPGYARLSFARGRDHPTRRSLRRPLSSGPR